MIGYYNYTVILTYVGMLFGFAGITYVGSGNLKMALICLLMAGLCDMFDGKVASTRERTKQEKRFGVQIDSLSDLICFGVLPAVIVVRCSNGKMPAVVISAVYVLCALIRLAWFNVDEEERQDVEETGRKVYLGLPVTTSAILVPAFVDGTHLLNLPLDKLFPWLLALIAVAFVAPFHLRKPNTVGKLLMMLCGAATLALVLIGVRG